MQPLEARVLGLALALTLAAVACGTPAPKCALVPMIAGGPSPPATVPEVALCEATDASDREALARTDREAREIVLSPEFAARVRAWPKPLRPGVGAEARPASEALDRYLAQRPPFHQLPTEYVPSDTGCASQTAATGLRDGRAMTTLNRCTLERARDTTPAAHACAINTIAHEWSHAVVDGEGEQVNTDKKHAPNDELVSYTIGAIAQCVYLDRFYVVGDKLESCVTQIGTSTFASQSCDAGWVTQFAKR